MIGTDQMTPGLVSVVICAYNNWPDVEMTTASALHQSYHPVEVIVVDNSSSDATPQEIPRRFGKLVQYIRQPNRECAGAYNAGFAVARGEFIQFVDGDDVLAPNKIQKQVEVFRENPEMDIVYGDFRYFQTLAGPANWEDVATQPEEDMLRRSIVLDGQWVGITTLGALFHRRALERVGPWDETLYIEDDDYWMRAAYAGCRYGHCPGSPMGFKRIRPGQKGKNASAMAQGAERVWEKALGYVTREPYRTWLAQELARRRFHVAVTRHDLSRREALAKLAQARATSPEAISALCYAAGCAVIVLPGGSALARSPRWRPIRRVLSRFLHFRTQK
ncbi:MAG: hypothetical protein A3H27_03230 [Acidobacteria bacterium RIFCSPLOWO2_02_FULL_59_13]|nr:MAG: hypothetical protein A3H27_03230 [Acidobacteria bacterium RIFCSPLOWO2_02_FULL_59_13]OFW32087.1 MAG: hypothetical protein A3J28_08460 [Acidobacteria bacterium RIFCSPLOWO2_12_FULL_60_22]